VNQFLLPRNPQVTAGRNQFPIRGFRMVKYDKGTFTYTSPLIFPRSEQ
jgi:hypothetical protein